MLTDDGKHLYVSWDEYHLLIERLALKVHASGWQFDQILCLARGGMRPGDVLSRVFDKPLGIMSTSSYRAEAGHDPRPSGHRQVHHHAQGRAAGRVLLVDDLADSGVTLKAVVERLRGMPSISELRSAVIWTKSVSEYTPGLLRRDAGNQPVDPSAVRGLRLARPDALAKKFAI
ncbi:phosphoribosyl transferase domain-containing protein [Ditylenchus destructor]|nr:phosphoribosyl transferase domain-containing protein [Ditylenchus destructor]